MKIDFESISSFLKRHIVWITLGSFGLLFLGFNRADISTLLLICTIEALALALSGLALFAYTRVDFTKDFSRVNLGLVFLGVHICVGLVVLGVYLAQY